MSGITRRKPGWLDMYIDGLRAWFLERGYTPGSIKQILTLAGSWAIDAGHGRHVLPARLGRGGPPEFVGRCGAGLRAPGRPMA
jgi:hypothetical protein